MYPKDTSGEESGSCRILSSRGVQTKSFSFLLLKQVKHEVTCTVSLSKYKDSEGIHLVLRLTILGPVERAKKIPPRPVRCPQS